MVPQVILFYDMVKLSSLILVMQLDGNAPFTSNLDTECFCKGKDGRHGIVACASQLIVINAALLTICSVKQNKKTLHRSDMEVLIA